MDPKIKKSQQDSNRLISTQRNPDDKNKPYSDIKNKLGGSGILKPTSPLKKEESEPLNSVSRNTFNTGLTFKRDTSKKTLTGMKDFMFGVFNKKQLKVIDYNVLSDLGDIGHVTFDKTDTLTINKIEIKMISTKYRIYNLNTDTVVSTLAEISKDPEKYRKRDDLTEKMNAAEIECYSEKSQEFEEELDGNFISEVFDEDSSLLDVFKATGIKMDIDSVDNSMNAHNDTRQREKSYVN